MFTVTVAGHLGKDPETRFTPTGQKVTAFNIAVNQRKGKEDITVWVKITIWGDRFDKMLTYLKKGSAVIVTGRMNPPSAYMDKEGRPQCSLELTAEMVEFSPFGKTERSGDDQGYTQGNASSAQDSQSNASQNYTQAPKPAFNAPNSQYGQANQYTNPIDEDDLPF